MENGNAGDENDGKQIKSVVNENEDKVSIVSIVCRICFDDNKDETIITPCHCKGTVAFVHRSCLEKWLAESNTTSCELCHHVYETERVPKYTARQSMWKWFKDQPNQLGFHIRRTRGDLLACIILTPLAIVITYICLFSADYYNQRKFSNIPAAKWTSISLLVMISIMLFGYYVWVYVVVGYHGRTWYYWWQRECVVRYIPPTQVVCEEGCIPNFAENDDSCSSSSGSHLNVTVEQEPKDSHCSNPEKSNFASSNFASSNFASINCSSNKCTNNNVTSNNCASNNCASNNFASNNFASNNFASNNFASNNFSSNNYDGHNYIVNKESKKSDVESPTE